MQLCIAISQYWILLCSPCYRFSGQSINTVIIILYYSCSNLFFTYSYHSIMYYWIVYFLCAHTIVQLQLDAVYDSQDSLLEFNIQCSTLYTTPIYITLIERNGLMNQTTYTCSNRTLRFGIVPSNGCNRDIELCGYFTFENGSVIMERPLNCSNSVVVPCPTSPPTTTQPGPLRKCIIVHTFNIIISNCYFSTASPGAIVAIVVGVLATSLIIILIVVIVIVVYMFVTRRRHHPPDIMLEPFEKGNIQFESKINYMYVCT